MPALNLVLTAAGLDALVDAQSGATDAIVIAELGLADAAFTAAPTLEALPNEFKRIEAVAGQSAAPNIIHMVAQDSSAEIYSAYGVGLFLSDGTLFATYAQEEPIVNKVSIAAFLIAFDVAFLDAVDTAIEFGDATFLYPPATETTKGVAELATEAEADTGTDTQRIMTPALVKRIVDAAKVVLNASITAVDAAQTAARTAAVAALNASITALTGRTITGAGLATGGGDLSANRVITVTAAGGDVSNPLVADKAVTPADLWSFSGSGGGTGLFQIPGTKYWVMFATGSVAANSSTTVTLPGTFATACAFACMAGGRADTAAEENDPFVQNWTQNSVTVFSAAGATVGFTIMAIGY